MIQISMRFVVKFYVLVIGVFIYVISQLSEIGACGIFGLMIIDDGR